MGDTPVLDFEEMTDGNDGAEDIHNSNFRRAEVLFAQNVIDRDLTAPPGGESDGDCYIPAATATGLWAGLEGNPQIYQAALWKNVIPVLGMPMFVADEKVPIRWDGSAWLAEGGRQLITDAATIAWDTKKGLAGHVTITAVGRTMGAPTGLYAGARLVLEVIQDGTGSRTITTWNAAFLFVGGAAPVLTAAAGAKDVITFEAIDGTTLIETGRNADVK